MGGKRRKEREGGGKEESEEREEKRRKEEHLDLTLEHAAGEDSCPIVFHVSKMPMWTSKCTYRDGRYVL